MPGSGGPFVFRQSRSILDSLAPPGWDNLSNRIFCKEASMELRDCKCYYGGQDMNFAIFSDDLCRARYLESILLPIGQVRVDVYQVEPGGKSRWVVVQQTDGAKNLWKCFARTGHNFSESETYKFPSKMRAEIRQKIPQFGQETSALVA
jgi:hypothetical protein